MMGIHLPQKELFSYEVDLDRRVRADHPLRRLDSILDLSFVRAEVARSYGRKGHVSVDPVVLVKLMILPFLPIGIRAAADYIDRPIGLGWGQCLDLELLWVPPVFSSRTSEKVQYVLRDALQTIGATFNKIAEVR